MNRKVCTFWPWHNLK